MFFRRFDFDQIDGAAAERYFEQEVKFIGLPEVFLAEKNATTTLKTRKYFLAGTVTATKRSAIY